VNRENIKKHLFSQSYKSPFLSKKLKIAMQKMIKSSLTKNHEIRHQMAPEIEPKSMPEPFKNQCKN
jgi:hypothetical protein